MHARKIRISTVIFLALAAAPAAASATPSLQTDEGCYLVGQKVTIAGSGFPVASKVAVTIDGIGFGTPTADATGGFTGSLIPGGLGANVVQRVHTLSATDGPNLVGTSFTVTRTTGARILTSTGKATKLRAPFQVWGFRLPPTTLAFYPLPAPPLRVYVHYISPHKHLRATVALGRTSGQCGYLKTARRRVFPFIPSRGRWRLQIDSHRKYFRHPSGPAAKIIVRVH